MRAIYYLLDGTVFISPVKYDSKELIDILFNMNGKFFKFSGFTKRKGLRKFQEITETEAAEIYEKNR